MCLDFGFWILDFEATAPLRVSRVVASGEAVAVDGFPGISKLPNPKGVIEKPSLAKGYVNTSVAIIFQIGIKIKKVGKKPTR